MRRMINVVFGLHVESCVLVRRRTNDKNDKCIRASCRVLCAHETEKE
jgi:hypothetical protein